MKDKTTPILVLAPLPKSMQSLVLSTIRNLKANNLQSDRMGIWAYITSAYKLSKEKETELFDVLDWMGIK